VLTRFPGAEIIDVRPSGAATTPAEEMPFDASAEAARPDDEP
jgi:hypothetical protein